MIAQLTGTLAEKTPTRIILDVNGVGYEVQIPLTTYEKLDELGMRVKLQTYLNVREDALQLFGFSTSKEKAMFLNLISVSGIGPKVAIGILSGSPVDELTRLIVNGDADSLTRLPGVGRKTAQRLITELKEKLTLPGMQAEPPAVFPIREQEAKFEEAVMALISLGYNKNQAQKSIYTILKNEPSLPLDELVRKVLQAG
ncbi:MAG TPA: Holliday junction branch migration protein RuvA [bacterium]